MPSADGDALVVVFGDEGIDESEVVVNGVEMVDFEEAFLTSGKVLQPLIAREIREIAETNR